MEISLHNQFRPIPITRVIILAQTPKGLELLPHGLQFYRVVAPAANHKLGREKHHVCG